MKVLTQGVSLITITIVKLLQDCLQQHIASFWLIKQQMDYISI